MTKWPWLNRSLWWLGGLLIIAGTVATLAGIAFIKYRQIQAAMATPPPPESPVAVGLATAQPITFRPTSVVVGTVLAPRFIQLRTELPGLVTAVFMEPGQTVHQGQVLVQLDGRSETAELKSATAALQLAQADLARMQTIANTNAVSAQESDVAQANVTRAEAEVDRLTVLIDRKTIRAPFDARVGLHQLHVGQYLDAGAQMTTLEGIDQYFEIDFSVPKHVAQSIRIGELVGLNVGSSRLDDAPTVVQAPVTAVDAKADAISRTMMIRARIQDPPATMRPNDSVRVIVEYGDTIQAIAVPATAIRNSPSGPSLFVAVERDGLLRAATRSVAIIGTGDGTHSWISTGLTGGEQVVAEGSFKVQDGMLLAPTPIARKAQNSAKQAEPVPANQDATDQVPADLPVQPPAATPLVPSVARGAVEQATWPESP
jgi:membrane fusion protein, multidrug efflux system